MYPQSQSYPQQPGFARPSGQPGYPQAGYPQAGYPQAGYPQGSYPQAGYPQGGYPQGGYPQAGYPQAGYNQGGYPPNPSVTVHIDPNIAGGGGGGGGSRWQGSSPSGLFSEKATRNAFVSKVYTILSAQLAFTVFLISICVFMAKSYFAKNQAWLFLGMAIFFISYLILVCVQSSRRSFPTNFILLSILTFGMALEAAVISCRYDTQVVLYAAFTCAVSTILISMFAKYTSFDMTSCGTVLCILALVHMFVGIILLFVLGPTNARLGSLIMAIFGAFLVMLYLIFDTQLIMGGRKEELSPEEYILGAILLYVDIVQMFLFLLEIFQRMSDD